MNAFATKDKGLINVVTLKENTDNDSRRIQDGLIAPAKEEVVSDVVEDHAAKPIKSMADIERISKYLIDNKRYRDNMLFIVGINVGLRISDLRMLRFCDIIDDDFRFKKTFAVFEKKTRNTRKRKKNRYITINQSVIDAVTLYLENTKDVSMSDYMFRSQSNRGGSKNEPLTNKSVDRILKGISEDLNLSVTMSTHTLRKTFAYWVMVFGNNDYRRLLLLQKMFNHSSPLQTLAYIGLDQEEIEAAYMDLNLGTTRKQFVVCPGIGETEECVG